LIESTELYDVILDMPRSRRSPQRISGTLKVMFPNHPEYQVSYGSVYKAIYARSYGELRKELIAACVKGIPSAARGRAVRIAANKSRIWSAFICADPETMSVSCLATGKAALIVAILPPPLVYEINGPLQGSLSLLSA
jgi:hypothetical protein